ncbi:hypothetical protein SUDANB121_03133 [Nocardiopsis dassonvillei]|uniref:alpha/beta hydrolase domain-containing protein n=1 Tax=Nocardiopsis dassonvillei TaxID=2014 RepID=UPI003F55A904
MRGLPRRTGAVWAVLCVCAMLAPSTVHAEPAPAPLPVPAPEVEGPLPGSAPGDPASDDIAETYPFFSTDADLASYGYVEEEFVVSGTANRYGADSVVSEHPYRTRVVVRRPSEADGSNGTALVEWQNVTAGHDLDALWATSADHIMRTGYTWVGVSAQNVGVSHLTRWSPARYGDLDVTDGGAVGGDALSYDVFAQSAAALREPGSPLTGDVGIDQVLAIGASQSAIYMTTYYEEILPLTEPVFDGYGFMVGSAPPATRPEPVFQVLSETDVALPLFQLPEESAGLVRWEVAGAAHSGQAGREARRHIEERDLGGQGEYDCLRPPFSRVPLHQVINASYDHLSAWAADGTAPPTAEPIRRTGDGGIARDEDGHALGGIRLSQVEVPTALNTGTNTGSGGDAFFCSLFGTHVPYSRDELRDRYRGHGDYVSRVNRVERRNVSDGYITPADSRENRREAARSGTGR